MKLRGRDGEKIEPEETEPNTLISATFQALGSADIPSANVPDASQRPQATEPTTVGFPEHPHPGESASNGKAERAARSAEDQKGFMKAALEARRDANSHSLIRCQHGLSIIRLGS